MVLIEGHAYRGKSVNAYPVGVSVKSNGAWAFIGISDGAYVSAEYWRVTSMPDTKAISVKDCRDRCLCKELSLSITPPFQSSDDAKSGKEERHGSFWAMIL